MINIGHLEDTFFTNLPTTQIYEKVFIWLKSSSCRITESKEETYLKAIFKGSITEVPLRPLIDPFSKEISVDILDFGDKRQLKIRVLQGDQRHGMKGLPYWGVKISELKKRLEAENTKSNTNLDVIITKRLNGIKREFVALIGGSLILVYLLKDIDIGLSILILIAFGAPISMFLGSEYSQLTDIINGLDRAIRINSEKT